MRIHEFLEARFSGLVVALATLALVGCGPDGGEDEDAGGGEDTMMADTGGPDTMKSDTTEPDTGRDTGMDTGTDDDTMSAGPTEFEVTVKNISDTSGSPTPFAPGTWAVHTSADPFFTAGMEDRGDGLEKLAEDGGGGMLAGNIEGKSGIAGAGAFGSGPIVPGDSATFSFEASPSDGALSIASMVVQTNDQFIAPADDAIVLFDADGNPMSERDVTRHFAMFDAGTERDQAPWFGRDQAPRQASKGDGAEEGVVDAFNGATRALPLARGIVDVSVSESGGDFTVTVENVSKSMGAAVTPVAPVFHAVHDSSWSFFSPGSQASAGLETLAEDGSPADLVSEHTGDSGAKTVAAATTPVGGSMGPAAPGEKFEFTVAPDSSHGKLSFAAMVVASNDAYLALKGGGVDLMDGSGNPRDTGELEAEIQRRLAVWDAGTEQNQVAGVGSNQPMNGGKGVGPDDSDNQIRLYSDDTNDLAGDEAGGFLDVTITHGTGSNDFKVTVENTSGSTAYTGKVTPVAWAVTDGNVPFFESGTEASSGLEQLAEDGKASPFESGLPSSGVGSSGVAKTPDGAGSAGPLAPGDTYTFTVTPDQTNRFLNIASMVVPSNDTFVALGETGIELLDSSGNRRSESDIETDVKQTLSAYDAGTEVDQAGAIGPDQAPHQSGPDTGPSEGDGTVQKLMNGVWAYPEVGEIVEITVAPK